MPHDPGVTRRSLVNWVLGTGVTSVAASVLYPILRFIAPPAIPEAEASRVLAGRLSELAAARWKIFKFGSDPGILVRTEEGEIRAFAATCTHLDCTVQYRPDLRRIWCACHNGTYDLNGANVSGPPPRPLARYTVNVVGDEIYVSKV